MIGTMDSSPTIGDLAAAIGDAKRLTLATGATWTRTAIAESTYTATRKASIRYTRKSPRGR